VTNLPSSHDEKYVAIVGQGYVGLPLAMAAAKAGWSVVGIEKSESRVQELNLGSSPVEDVLDDVLQKALTSEKYFATSDVSKIAKCRIVIVCVPTPLNDSREPDLTLLEAAILEITPYLSNETLIVSESTSYPGTLRNIILPLVKANSKSAEANHSFASAPERVNPGDKNWDMKNTPRLVGGIDTKSQELAVAFYKTFCDEVVATSSPEIAEAAKLLENTFRMVNISLVLELTQILEKSGLSMNEVIDAAATKPYGFMPFRPSVGIGGHCIPIDPLYLTWWAKEQGQSANLVEKADQISQSMPQYVANKTLSLVESSKKSPTVMILGVAYKSGVSDTRESPVSLLKSSLESAGANVIWHDPLVKEWAGTTSSDLDSAFDVAVIATNQPGMDVESIIARGIRVLDCTNNFGHLVGVEVL
jgi:UDP-N-acetyl-D-glucosamine dehydrogenase